MLVETWRRLFISFTTFNFYCFNAVETIAQSLSLIKLLNLFLFTYLKKLKLEQKSWKIHRPHRQENGKKMKLIIISNKFDRNLIITCFIYFTIICLSSEEILLFLQPFFIKNSCSMQEQNCTIMLIIWCNSIDSRSKWAKEHRKMLIILELI